MAVLKANDKEYLISGVQVAILNEEKVFIQLRPLPPGWELPGGHCGDYEDPMSCAKREVVEETGLKIELVGLVGIYSFRGLRKVSDALFLGKVIGGTPKRSIEAWASKYVSSDNLPRTLFPWYRQRIEDAFAFMINQTEPIHRIQQITPYHVILFATKWLQAPLDLWHKWRQPRNAP